METRYHVRVPAPSSRTTRQSRDRGTRPGRQPEGSADGLNGHAAAIADHAPRQPAADDRSNRVLPIACPATRHPRTTGTAIAIIPEPASQSGSVARPTGWPAQGRSEEHTSEL